MLPPIFDNAARKKSECDESQFYGAKFIKVYYAVRCITV